MAKEVQLESVGDARRKDFGSNEDAMEQRRAVEKLIKDGDEQAIPKLMMVLDSHLNAQKKSSRPAAMKSAIGLGKLGRSGSDRYKEITGLDDSIEEILIRALQRGSNDLQCAAADALALIGDSDAETLLKEASGEDGRGGDKNPTVRARAKIALRRMHINRGVGALIDASRTRGPSTAQDIEAMIHRACDSSSYAVERNSGGAFTIKVHLKNGRSQEVAIKPENRHDHAYPNGEQVHSRYMLLSTRCAPASSELFEKVLKLNALRMDPLALGKVPYGFAHGSLAIRDGELVMIETLQLDTLDVDEIKHSISILATVGDEIEKLLLGGKDAR